MFEMMIKPTPPKYSASFRSHHGHIAAIGIRGKPRALGRREFCQGRFFSHAAPGAGPCAPNPAFSPAVKPGFSRQHLGVLADASMPSTHHPFILGVVLQCRRQPRICARHAKPDRPPHEEGLRGSLQPHSPPRGHCGQGLGLVGRSISCRSHQSIPRNCARTSATAAASAAPFAPSAKASTPGLYHPATRQRACAPGV